MKMETLQMQQKAIKLGNQLIEEMNLTEQGDSLSLWVTHYIAEQITLLEANETEETKEKCFNAILKLWAHRYNFDTHEKDFELIYKTLLRLQPENNTGFTYSDLEVINTDKSEKEIDERKYINAIIGIDQIAKELIRTFLNFAVSPKIEERDIDWYKEAVDLNLWDYSALSYQLLSETEETELTNEQRNDEERLKVISQLEHRIAKINQFEQFAGEIKQELQLAIEALRGEIKST